VSLYLRISDGLRGAHSGATEGVPARRQRRVIAYAALLLVLGSFSCGDSADPPSDVAANLLAGSSVLRSPGVRNSARVTDGLLPADGSHWNSDSSAVFGPRDAWIDYDLGRPTELAAVFVLADNNDLYELLASMDAEHFTPLWISPRVAAPGMQPRAFDGLSATARYLRLRPAGGDGSYSVSELQVFSRRPETWPPQPERQQGPEAQLRPRAAALGAAFCLLLALLDRRIPRILRGAALVLLFVASLRLGATLGQIWPVSPRDVSFLRAGVAALGAATLVRAWFGRAHWRPRWTTGLLALLALASVALFYDLGRPQFWNHAAGRPTFVHTPDMRVYFPVAKYFPELRFDGLYLASLAAYLDDAPGATPQSIADVRVRDLRDNRVVTAGMLTPEIEALPSRFSAARWRSFNQDMRWFRETMGPESYLGTLVDHGGNATPVWILAAHLLFSRAPASEGFLQLTALIDPALLLLCFIAIARSFGLHTMLLCLILFGTTDFVRFGATLVGSTLRFDWIAALGLAACAFKTGRPLMGGSLITLSALIRAFPAAALPFLAVPALWWSAERLRASPRAFLPAFWREQRPLLRTVLGSTLCGVTLMIASTAAFTFEDGWGAWFEKISIHADKPNVNHVGWRTALTYEPDKKAEMLFVRAHPEPWTLWQEAQLAAFSRRKPVFWLGVVAFAGLAILACRGRPLHEAILVGMLMVPVLFYPANYYLHYVALLPLLASERSATGETPGLWWWIPTCLLILCVAQYPTLAESWADVCFAQQSWILLACFSAILVPLAWRGAIANDRR